ncbi:ribosomal RNA small subunit methyltransferase H [Alphaproteobacteria bacterium]|nr:ribosomal RNA small subunit methyltransferase H [Alphaproteobacteria bacterium]
MLTIFGNYNIIAQACVFCLAFVLMVHIPVLLNEVIEILCVKQGEKIIDATFGGGGHTMAILESCDCCALGIDRDPEASERAKIVKQKYNDRFNFIQGKFSELSNIISDKFDAILFDFGISSFQLEEAERGFSFANDGPLDMRMSKNSGISAFEVVNKFQEEDIAEIIWKYGEERKSRAIAKKIVEERKNKAIKTTRQLRDIVASVFNKAYSKIDVATKTFQAIRIFVNDELKEVDAGLRLLPEILKNGARIATIAFHSLEDLIVKNWAKEFRTCVTQLCDSPITPSREEILQNPRSRAGILRGFVYNSNI